MSDQDLLAEEERAPGTEIVAREEPRQLVVGAIVDKQQVAFMKEQRELLKDFVSSQLRRANFSDQNKGNYGEGDYGVIPGTKKRSLLKPGAEKILRLFQLGAKFQVTDKIIDRLDNFAMFSYKCIIFHLATGKEIAEAEGSVNSQEKKYATRMDWKDGKKTEIPTPICDILNTLQKMAQKRALIAAVILATGASDYFTQDMEDEIARDRQGLPKEKGSPAPAVHTPGSQHSPPGGAGDSKELPPICCEQPMKAGIYIDKELGCKPWWCPTCKKKVARV